MIFPSRNVLKVKKNKDEGINKKKFFNSCHKIRDVVQKIIDINVHVTINLMFKLRYNFLKYNNFYDFLKFINLLFLNYRVYIHILSVSFCFSEIYLYVKQQKKKKTSEAVSLWNEMNRQTNNKTNR